MSTENMVAENWLIYSIALDSLTTTKKCSGWTVHLLSVASLNTIYKASLNLYLIMPISSSYPYRPWYLPCNGWYCHSYTIWKCHSPYSSKKYTITCHGGDGTISTVPLRIYRKPSQSAMKSVIIGPLEPPVEEPTNLKSAKLLDTLWVTNFVLGVSPVLCPFWSGFMQLSVRGEYCDKSRIEILPFINQDSSQPNTIYSALYFAQKLIDRHNLGTCPVTFDTLRQRKLWHLWLICPIYSSDLVDFISPCPTWVHLDS